VLEGEHLVALAPAEPMHEHGEGGGGVLEKGDVVRLGVDEARQLCAEPVVVVKPGQEIRAGRLIAVREVPGDGFHRAGGELAEGGGVEIRPLA